MYRRLPPVAAALLALAHSYGASAQEYCVTCTGPEATYRCLIGGEATPAARSSRGQFLCITELAKAGGHASCSAARGQATPCPGETRTVMFSLADPGPGGLATGTVSPQPSAPAGSGVSYAPGQELPPVTVPTAPVPPGAPPPHDSGATPQQPQQDAVENLATKTGKAMSDTGKAVGNAVNDTGKAVGNAVKKSWDCVASLFGNC